MTLLTATERGATAAITGIFATIPKDAGWHSHGWARTWAENTGLPLNYDNEVVDELYFFHGPHPHNDRLNILNGWPRREGPMIRKRLLAAFEAKTVWSLDIPMPNYAKFLGDRSDLPDSDRELLLPRLIQLQERAKVLRSIDLGLDWVTVGDSHVAAWAPWGSMIAKNDGKTLWGEIRKDFAITRQVLKECPQVKGITMVFGNIDLRFHILRLDADWKMMYDTWKEFGDSLEIEVEYALPWPVEHEGWELPKVGRYKGESFYGTRQERSDLLMRIRDYMDKKRMLTVSYPESWYDIDPEQYAKTHMQRSGRFKNVHLSPRYYRRHSEWTDLKLSQS